MTRLFQCTSSGANVGGAGGGGQAGRLEFSRAVDHFRTMFPGMDREVIECVLRANRGGVDATVEQLLQMSSGEHASGDSSDEDSGVPPEILDGTLEPDSSDEESPPSYNMHIYDRKYPEVPSVPPPRFDGLPPHSDQQVRGYRNWNPPLLGSLPDDFLRILPQQLNSLQDSQPSSSSLSSVAPGGAAAAQGESRLRQYLEDERVALSLQNQEFVRELQRNREFLLALESGGLCTSDTCKGSPVMSEDPLFHDKLKHMGKSTRRKLFKMARAFSAKTKRKKTKSRDLLKQQSPGTAASSANLLDDKEGNPGEKEGQPRSDAGEAEEMQEEEHNRVLPW